MLADQCYIVTYKTQHQQRIIDGQNEVGATEPFAKSYYNFFLGQKSYYEWNYGRQGTVLQLAQSPSMCSVGLDPVL